MAPPAYWFPSNRSPRKAAATAMEMIGSKLNTSAVGAGSA